jgi:hypothetical protein
MRNPYGHLNPLKTEYVANLIKEIDRRVDSPEYNDEIEPLNPKKHLYSVESQRSKREFMPGTGEGQRSEPEYSGIISSTFHAPEGIYAPEGIDFRPQQ